VVRVGGVYDHRGSGQFASITRDEKSRIRARVQRLYRTECRKVVQLEVVGQGLMKV